MTKTIEDEIHAVVQNNDAEHASKIADMLRFRVSTDMGIDYSSLPAHMQPEVRSYIERGVPPCYFLEAVFQNNLVEAFGRADTDNTFAMRDYAAFLYGQAPRECWGSKAAVNAWISHNGLAGAEK